MEILDKIAKIVYRGTGVMLPFPHQGELRSLISETQLSIESQREVLLNEGAIYMAEKIRQAIETGEGVFADIIQEDGKVVQSDANWIVEQFKGMVFLDDEIEGKARRKV